MAIEKVSVLGSGTMGAGIAQVCALAGCDVVLHDLSPDLAEKGLQRIRKSLDKGVEKNKVTPEARGAALRRIRLTANLSEAAAAADLVVEAVPEDLELKRRVFSRISGVARPGAILATNTSALSIGAIAAATQDPSRVVGMHFFNPVPIMKLLELVVGEKTSRATVDKAKAFGARLGKEVVTVKDSPGFASSRLGICLAMEAIRMLESGVASAEDIDRAMVYGYGHPMGPLRLTDLVGLDVRLAIAEHLAGALSAPHFQPPALLRKMVEEGRLGKKSGRGFYDWEQGPR